MAKSPSNTEQLSEILVTCLCLTFPLNGLILFRFFDIANMIVYY